MAQDPLHDKSQQPRDDDLAEALGRCKAQWDELIAHIDTTCAPITRKWGPPYKEFAWSLRLIRKKRTILYLIPCRRYFLCAFVLGGKATEAARAGSLPDNVMTIINEAPVYGEGRGFRLEVRKKADVGTMKKLAAIKMAN